MQNTWLSLNLIFPSIFRLLAFKCCNICATFNGTTWIWARKRPIRLIVSNELRAQRHTNTWTVREKKRTTNKTTIFQIKKKKCFKATKNQRRAFCSLSLFVPCVRAAPLKFTDDIFNALEKCMHCLAAHNVYVRCALYFCLLLNPFELRADSMLLSLSLCVNIHRILSG